MGGWAEDMKYIDFAFSSPMSACHPVASHQRAGLSDEQSVSLTLAEANCQFGIQSLGTDMLIYFSCLHVL